MNEEKLKEFLQMLISSALAQYPSEWERTKLLEKLNKVFDDGKIKIPRKYLDCLDCDFSASTECGWQTCDAHEEEYDKWAYVPKTCGYCGGDKRFGCMSSCPEKDNDGY